MDQGRALLIANPRCLAARGLDVSAVRAALTDAGIRLAPMTVEPDIPAAELAHRASSLHVARLVAAGGDGTVHLVANAAARLGYPLAVLPLGTANDFAHGLGLPTGLADAAALAASGRPRAIDLGRVNGRYFLNAAHVGLGAETVRRADARLKRWLGPLAYAFAALGAWRASTPLSLVLRAEGQALMLKASQLLVGNGRFFGGGNLIAPEAALDDGRLDVQVFQPDLPAAAALRLAGALRRGELAEHPEALTFRTAKLEVVLDRPAHVNLDGELVELGEVLTFDVVPGAIEVVAGSPAAVGRESGRVEEVS